MKNIFTLFAVVVLLIPAIAKAWTDPQTSQTFDQAIQQLNLQQTTNYTFGTATGRNIQNLTELANYFSAYNIAGTSVLNGEWERYQNFNTTNFVFTPDTLNLTATIPSGGGLFAGGVFSGQICSKTVFAPGVTGANVYAITVHMRTPTGQGMWPSAWFYEKIPGGGVDGSEIDNPEFFDMTNQNQFDWTGYQHGPGQGADIYSIKTNQWVWHPGLNFSADFHDYQTLWTPDAVYKYVDGTLVYAQHFKWTVPANPAQLIVDLAVGSSNTSALPGLQPNSLSEFPASLQIESISVWQGN